MVKAIIKCSGETQSDLCGKRFVGNFLDWCDTPLVRKAAFTTTDGCWLFDETDVVLPSVVPDADDNVYVAIPQCRPVMAANKGRLLSSSA